MVRRKESYGSHENEGLRRETRRERERGRERERERERERVRLLPGSRVSSRTDNYYIAQK